jgi:hypothetical protein
VPGAAQDERPGQGPTHSRVPRRARPEPACAGPTRRSRCRTRHRLSQRRQEQACRDRHRTRRRQRHRCRVGRRPHTRARAGPDVGPRRRTRQRAWAGPGEGPVHAAGTLALLARAHLLQPARPGRFGTHDLLRAYAYRLTRTHDSEAERQAALVRLFDHYLGTAAAAMDTLYPAERHHRPAVGRPPSMSRLPSATRTRHGPGWTPSGRHWPPSARWPRTAAAPGTPSASQPCCSATSTPVTTPRRWRSTATPCGPPRRSATWADRPTR